MSLERRGRRTILTLLAVALVAAVWLLVGHPDLGPPQWIRDYISPK
jgi:hypothetical protein